MIICVCHMLTENDIRRMVRQGEPLPVLRCGKCRELMERMGVL